MESVVPWKMKVFSDNIPKQCDYLPSSGDPFRVICFKLFQKSSSLISNMGCIILTMVSNCIFFFSSNNNQFKIVICVLYIKVDWCLIFRRGSNASLTIDLNASPEMGRWDGTPPKERWLLYYRDILLDLLFLSTQHNSLWLTCLIATFNNISQETTGPNDFNFVEMMFCKSRLQKFII